MLSLAILMHVRRRPVIRAGRSRRGVRQHCRGDCDAVSARSPGLRCHAVVLTAATINGIGFLALALAPAHLILLCALGVVVGPQSHR